eukprot:TRINITY_DN83251_c0_g1_i1.p1 TRINITY_DN83251_c0_g1~~TRINITY_DN83251_c0_g1_i1.p1  ORF type:complete len:341 (+),score=78.33 TRINITY_DN83251_c0_g1_i1:72-1025(+)
MWCRNARFKSSRLAWLWLTLQIGASPRLTFSCLEAAAWQASKLGDVSTSRLANACRNQPGRSSSVGCRVQFGNAETATDQVNVSFLVGFIVLGLLSTLYQEGKRSLQGKKSPEMQVMEQLGSVWAKLTGADTQTQNRAPKINMEGIDSVPFQNRKMDANTSETQVQFLKADELQGAKRKLEASLQAMEAAIERLEHPGGKKQKTLDDIEDAGNALFELLRENSAILAQVQSADLAGISARLACVAELESVTEADRQRTLALRGRLEALVCHSSLDDDDALELLEAEDDEDVKAVMSLLDSDRQENPENKTGKRKGER